MSSGETVEEIRTELDEAPAGQRGRLKIFLGYASGVGKSRRLFEEAKRRKDRGQDVVVGAVQDHVPADTAPLLEMLEVIPPLMISGQPVVDTQSIQGRHPQICVIDGLAYDNPPGAYREFRWQDVEALLACGISVLGSVNIQYIAEQGDAVEKITGKRAQQTVPEKFVTSADEIVLVDAPPELLNGDGDDLADEYGGAEKAGRMARLRELALLLTASVLDHSLDSYLRSNGIERTWRTQERILVYLTPDANFARLIETAKRNSDRFHGEFLAAYVKPRRISGNAEAKLKEGLALAENAGARVAVLDGSDPLQSVLRFAREHRTTQIFISHDRRPALWARWFGTRAGELVRLAGDIDVRVIPG